MTDHPAQLASAREWTGLAVLALPTLLVSIDVSVILLALPRISAELGAGSAEQLWIMDIYGFMLAGFMITMGTLGDRIGRRKLVMIGGAAFALASVLAAFAPTPGTLIAARALLGVAGATLSPSILALITNMFREERQRGMAISIWLTCFMGGMALGPLVGGVMIERFWWGAPFLLGVPVMLLLLLAAPILLPEYRDETAGRIDLKSVLLSLAAILPIVYALKEFAKGENLAEAGIALVVGATFMALFIARQLRLDDPLLNLSLFANRAFSAVVAGMFLITMTGALMLFVAQYLQLVVGLTPTIAGVLGLPGILASVAGFMLSPIIARHMRPAHLIAGGLVLACLGAVVLMMAVIGGDLLALIAGFVLFNLGCTPMVSLGTGILLGTVPPEKAGSAAALQETCSELGFSLGIAAFGSLAIALYRAGLASAMPDGVGAEAAAGAFETLAGAVETAAALSNGIGVELLVAAREAFSSATAIVTVIEAAILLLVAVVVVLTLRHIGPLGTNAGHASAPEADAPEGQVEGAPARLA